MGIPRKNLRKISIHCRDYNYIVKKNDTDLCLTVQEDVDRPGAVMQCKWPSGHAITPEDELEAKLGLGDITAKPADATTEAVVEKDIPF